MSINAYDGSRRRLSDSNSTANITVSISTPIPESLAASGNPGDLFKEPDVQLSFQINCTEGIQEMKYAHCPDQTYGYQCDGLENTLNKIDCLTAAVVPVCGMHDRASNSWMTENCFEQPSDDSSTVKCTCVFDHRTVNPDFASMARTIGSSFAATIIHGVRHLFTVKAILENPTMFYTLGGMSLLALLMTYRGYQLDQRDKVKERDRVLLDLNVMTNEKSRLQKIEREDTKKRKEAIRKLKNSSDLEERRRGELMEDDMKRRDSKKNAVARMGGAGGQEVRTRKERTAQGAKRRSATDIYGIWPETMNNYSLDSLRSSLSLSRR